MFLTSLNVATHLVLLLLEGSLGLLESSLQLLFLHLEPPSLLVQVVDGAAAVAKLVKKILDLVSKVLVLSSDNIQLLHGLIIGGLRAIDFRAVVASLRPARLQL